MHFASSTGERPLLVISTAALTRRTRRGCSGDHASALLPAALAFDLMGGRAVLGHAPGHADVAAVAAEEFPVRQPRGFGDGLDPPGDLGLRKPEDFVIGIGSRRPDGGEGLHGGGGDGDHRALGLSVGLGADHGDAAGVVLPAPHVAPDECPYECLSPASAGMATKAKSNLSFFSVFRRFEAAAAPAVSENLDFSSPLSWIRYGCGW